ncbi:MAG: type I secretion system permease/ATPase [Alphaproteobacteria bacterium]
MQIPGNELPATVKEALKACKSVAIVVFIFSTCVNLLMLTVPIYMLQVYDRVLTTGSMPTLTWLTIICVSALAVLALMDATRGLVAQRVSHWFDRVLAKPVLSTSIQGSAMSHGNGTVQGLRDLSAIRNFIGSPQIFHFFDAPFVPFFIAVIFLIHPLLGSIAIFAAIVIFCLALLNNALTKTPLEEANKAQMRQLNTAETGVRNAEVIEAMGMLDPLIKRWDADNNEVLDYQQKASTIAGRIGAFTKFFRLGIQLSMLGFGVYLAVQQQITPGAMIAGSIILGRALAPVEQMIGAWKGFIGYRQAKERLDQMLAASPGGKRGTTEYPEPVGLLTAEGATYMIPGVQKPILRQVAFRLEPGTACGLIGPSASGKTTLARLIVGVLPCSAGKIRLDGVDVFDWNRADFGRHVGYMPQDVELFPGTVKDNIARMVEAPDEAVIEAAKAANAHDLILRLPRGYDTPVGAFGANLSAGQRQRIALARAFFGGPKLLILDEPNANLDGEGEQALMESLSRARDNGTTIVVIAHRPSVLEFVDKLLVLRDGMVEAFDDKEAVMQKLRGGGGGAAQQPQPTPITAAQNVSAAN